MALKIIAFKDKFSIKDSAKPAATIPVTTTTYSSCGTGTATSSKSGAAAVVNYSSCGSSSSSTNGANGSSSATKFVPGETSKTTNYSSCSTPTTSYSSCGKSTTSASKTSTSQTTTKPTVYSMCGSSSTSYSSCGKSTTTASNTANTAISYTSCGTTTRSSCGTKTSSTSYITSSAFVPKTILAETTSITSTPSSYVEQIFIIEDPRYQVSSSYKLSNSARYVLSGSAHGATYYILRDEITSHAKETGWYIDFTFLLNSYSYKLADLTMDNLETKIEYIENPYEPGEFFKRETSIRLYGASSQETPVKISTPSLSTVNLSIGDIVSRFIQNNRFEDDGIIKLRGNVVNENIFNEKRKKILLNTIGRFFFNPFVIFNIRDSFNYSDSLVSIYNYAKAAIELVSQEEESNLQFLFPVRDLRSTDDVSCKLILITAPITAITSNPDLPSLERFTAPRRSIIEKLTTTNLYSLNGEYIKAYGQKVQEEKLVESARRSIPNPNGFIKANMDRIDLDNTNSYNTYTMHAPNVAANALREFNRTKRGIFLDIHINNAVIEKSIKGNDRGESASYVREDEKKVFSSKLVKPLGTDIIYVEDPKVKFSTSEIYFTKQSNNYVSANITEFANNTTYYTKDHYSVENILDEILMKRNNSNIVMKSFI